LKFYVVAYFNLPCLTSGLSDEVRTKIFPKLIPKQTDTHTL